MDNNVTDSQYVSCVRLSGVPAAVREEVPVERGLVRGSVAAVAVTQVIVRPGDELPGVSEGGSEAAADLEGSGGANNCCKLSLVASKAVLATSVSLAFSFLSPTCFGPLLTVPVMAPKVGLAGNMLVQSICCAGFTVNECIVSSNRSVAGSEDLGSRSCADRFESGCSIVLPFASFGAALCGPSAGLVVLRGAEILTAAERLQILGSGFVAFGSCMTQAGLFVNLHHGLGEAFDSIVGGSSNSTE